MQPDITSYKTERAPRSKLHLLYHELRPSGSRYSYVVDSEAFKRHLNIYAGLRNSPDASLWPEITFDDGHISNYEFALPCLQAQGLRAHFFITVGWTGERAGYMGWQELRALQSAGHTIGTHGLTHTLLTHCDKKQLDQELRVARLMLEEKLGVGVPTMSLPGGRYNTKILGACLEAGYTHVYTSNPQPESLPLGKTIGRLNIRGDMTPAWIASLFSPGSAVLAGLGRQYRMKEAGKLLLGDKLYGRIWGLLNRQEKDDTRTVE